MFCTISRVFRIDRDGTPRAFPRHPLHGRRPAYRHRSCRRSSSTPHRWKVHSVISADADEIRTDIGIGLLETLPHSPCWSGRKGGQSQKPAVTVPVMASLIPGRSSSSVMSPGPISLMPDLSSPRSTNCLARRRPGSPARRQTVCPDCRHALAAGTERNRDWPAGP